MGDDIADLGADVVGGDQIVANWYQDISGFGETGLPAVDKDPGALDSVRWNFVCIGFVRANGVDVSAVGKVPVIENGCA